MIDKNNMRTSWSSWFIFVLLSSISESAQCDLFDWNELERKLLVFLEPNYSKQKNRFFGVKTSFSGWKPVFPAPQALNFWVLNGFFFHKLTSHIL
jgi:hypothetical protein